MVDFDSNPMSIERCRELLGAEGRGLSHEAIETVRDQTDALAHLLIDMYLDQQRRERANWGRHQATGSIPVWFEKGSRLKTTA